MHKLLLAVSLVAGAACAGPAELKKSAGQQAVSIIQVIANPTEMDGKKLWLGGFLELRDEHEHSLFLDANASRSGMIGNSIAIDLDAFPEHLELRARELNGSYVFIGGKFKAGPTAFSWGKIEDVDALIPAGNEN